MGGSDARGRAPGLVGRGRQCTLIDGLLAAAARGDSSSLVLRGEAGIGKSALLGYAAERATGMQVLRVTGMEDESDLAFSGLHGLLWPVVGHLDELPAPQREALAAALGLGPPEGSERFLISAGVLSLLAAAAEERPVVCLIDDAQWLDVPSARRADVHRPAARRRRRRPLVRRAGGRPWTSRNARSRRSSSIRWIASRRLRCSSTSAVRSPRRCASDFSARRPGTRWPCSSSRLGSPTSSWPVTRGCRTRSR